MDVTGRRIVVVGAARSGLAAAELLSSRGAEVIVTDAREDVENRDKLEAIGVKLELGIQRQETLMGADLIVLSPGVSPYQPDVAAAKRAGVDVIGEVELASRWLKGKLVAITGTKGKSTTTVLAKRMLESGGFKVLVGGNIGQALSTQVPASTPDVVHLVEVSSFQLEQTYTFRPFIGVCLNIFSDHLDRHGSIQAYAEAKGRIFANQKNTDWAVVNADDPRSLELADRGQAKLLRFSMRRTFLDEGIVIANDFVVYRTRQRDVPLIPLSAVNLLGQHLVGGVLAAASVSMLLGVTAEQMTSAVEGYTGLEHVLEPVTEIKGVRFVNDSKATNIEAVRRSVESFDGDVVVIMGGRFKGGNLRELRPVLGERAVAVFAIGEARSLISQALGDVVPVSAVEGMAEAVRSAYAVVPQDGIVLLAPACASFDMYRDYAERGKNFKHEVKCLALELNSRREQ